MTDSTVLLLHGQPGSARDWASVVAALAGKVQPIVIDRPGWGRNGSATGLAGNVAAVVAALDRHSVQRAVLVTASERRSPR